MSHLIILLKKGLKYFMFLNFYKEIKINLVFWLIFFNLIMPLNIMIIFFSFFGIENGVAHQFLCVCTSNKMELLKGKIVTYWMLLVLLCFIWVSKSYWGVAILTICYLINWLPFSMLHQKTPYSMLFSLLPRLFGCVCFVHNFSPHKDKLDP